FIQHAGIPTAMVGLLMPLKGTRLYERYQQQGRLIDEPSGNNVCTALSYIPEIRSEVLIAGYKRVLASLYDVNLSNYFDRCYRLICRWNRKKFCARKVRTTELYALFRSLKIQLFSRQGPSYAKFLAKVVLSRPKMFSEAVRLAIMGYHYEKITREQIKVDEFKHFLNAEYERLQAKVYDFARLGCGYLHDIQLCLEQSLDEVQKRYCQINKDFCVAMDPALRSFQERLGRQLALYAPKLDFQIPQFIKSSDRMQNMV
ncbi:MAG TPA: DUF4070 domain-containing protein, partial [Oligoflexia bacterium]|nr:DUF4070 domain-containing protein [Oligoflexia bacterium]